MLVKSRFWDVLVAGYETWMWATSQLLDEFPIAFSETDSR